MILFRSQIDLEMAQARRAMLICPAAEYCQHFTLQGIVAKETISSQWNTKGTLPHDLNSMLL